MPRSAKTEKSLKLRTSKADAVANTARLALELKHYVGIALVILVAALSWHVAHARNLRLPGVEVVR